MDNTSTHGYCNTKKFKNIGIVIPIMVSFDDLTFQNPWWKDREAILKDPKVVEALSKTKKFIPKLEEKGFFSLRGPRQVGKSTMLKLFVHQLIIEKGIDVRKVMYFSCEPLMNKKEIIDVIKLYIDFAGSDECYVFLDEITFVPEWEHAIKFLIDSNMIRGTLYFTGSLASDLKKSKERMPGREIKERLILPLSFRNYLEHFSTIKLTDSLKFNELVDFRKVQSIVSELLPHTKELNEALESYLITGGFLKAIYALEEQKLGPEIYETYVKWILGDLGKLDKTESIFRQLIRGIIKKYGSGSSLSSFAKEFEIASHKTVADYLETLNGLMLLNLLYKIDISRADTVFKKEKKAYFIDPFLFSVFSGYIKGSYGNFVTEENKSFVLEGTVLEHLARFVRKRLNIADIWYYKDRKGEIDLVLKVVLKVNKEFLPLEIKWQEKVDERDFKHFKTFKKAILLSKKEFKVGENFLIIPLSVFLASLDVK